MEITPKDIDLSTKLQGKFGCVEFEEAICEIVRYLQDDSLSLNMQPYMGDNGTGWKKKFNIHTFLEIYPTLFAMLCASGWIQCSWFPKGTFTVSDGLIDRLTLNDGVISRSKL